jgi:hypothetical protein
VNSVKFGIPPNSGHTILNSLYEKRNRRGDCGCKFGRVWTIGGNFGGTPHLISLFGGFRSRLPVTEYASGKLSPIVGQIRRSPRVARYSHAVAIAADLAWKGPRKKGDVLLFHCCFVKRSWAVTMFISQSALSTFAQVVAAVASQGSARSSTRSLLYPLNVARLDH